MEEKEIITQLNQILQQLEEGEKFIENNKWSEVTSLFNKINAQHDAIQKSEPPIVQLCENNPNFNQEYQSLKKVLVTKVTAIIAAIESWRTAQVEKISGAKNVMTKISNYYKAPNKSYYFDRKE